MRTSKISTYPKSLHYNFNWNVKWKKYIYHCVGLGLAFLSSNTRISWFLCKKPKDFDRKLIREIKRKLNLFYNILKYSSIPLIWYLLY